VIPESQRFRSNADVNTQVSREIQVQIDQPNSIGEKEGITGYESSLEREQYELEHLPAQAKRTQF
jgi:hypothetical protein